MLIEYKAKDDVSLKEMKAKFNTWLTEYSPWLLKTKSFKDYKEKNAFKQSFIKGNLLQCFAKNFNEMIGREYKLLQNHKSIVIGNCEGAYLELISRLMNVFIETLDCLKICHQLSKTNNFKVVYTGLLNLGLEDKCESNLARLKRIVIFIFDYFNNKLINFDKKTIKKVTASLKTCIKSFLKAKIIARKEAINEYVGKVNIYPLKTKPKIYTLRPI